MLNLVILEGRATREAEIKKVGEHKACSFSIAVNDWRKDKDGKPTVSFIQCVAWDKVAEVLEHVHKGDLFSVSGRLQIRSYIDKNKITKQVTEVVVNEVNFLTPKSSHEGETRPVDDLPF